MKKNILLLVTLVLASLSFTGCSEKELVNKVGMSHYDYQRAQENSQKAQAELDKE